MVYYNRDILRLQNGRSHGDLFFCNGLVNRATIIYVLQEMADVLRAVLVSGDAWVKREVYRARVSATFT